MVEQYTCRKFYWKELSALLLYLLIALMLSCKGLLDNGLAEAGEPKAEGRRMSGGFTRVGP